MFGQPHVNTFTLYFDVRGMWDTLGISAKNFRFKVIIRILFD